MVTGKRVGQMGQRNGLVVGGELKDSGTREMNWWWEVN